MAMTEGQRVLPDISRMTKNGTGGRQAADPASNFAQVENTHATDPYQAVGGVLRMIKRGQTEIFSALVLVTPQVAEELLVRNTDNRRVNERLVTRLAETMLAEEWRVNGETIIVSSDGKLNDGQHRLNAVIEANKAVPMLFTFGVDRASRHTLDQGVKRSPGHIFEMYGEKNATHLASACRILLAYDRNMPFSTVQSVSTPEALLATLDNHPKLRDTVSDAWKFRTGMSVSASALGAAICLIRERHPLVCDTFVYDLRYGSNLKAGDPILTLRDRFLRHAAKTERMPTGAIFSFVIRTFNARNAGERLKMLRYDLRHPFPRVQ